MKEMKAVFEMIGPAKAQEYLNKNFENRRVRKNAVALMALDMLNGRWHDNGSPLRFDENGKFVDGQHRLHAIIKSQTTQKVLVVYDVPETAHNTIDLGCIPRSAPDVLQFNGIKYAKEKAAIAKKILIWNKNRTSLGIIATGAVSNTEIVEYCLDNDLSEYVEFAKKVYEKTRFFTQSETGFLFWLFSQIDYENAVDFLTSLYDGIGLQQDSPIYLLRQRLEKDYFAKSNLPASEKQAITIKAWNHYRTGRPLRKLAYKITEEKPMPV